MSTSILRNQLSARDRELFDLRYLDPTDGDGFARNVVTNLFKTDEDPGQRALVSIYAAPVEAVELPHSKLMENLTEETLGAALRSIGGGALLAGARRPMASGVIVHDGDADFTYINRTFTLRTSGSVELVVGEATRAANDWSGVMLRLTLIRTTQLLRYVARYGAILERDAWTLLVSVRDADRAVLADLDARFQSPYDFMGFRRSPQRALDRHLQFRAVVRSQDDDVERTRTVQRLDEYLSFAYGFSEPRGHDKEGRLLDA